MDTYGTCKEMRIQVILRPDNSRREGKLLKLRTWWTPNLSPALPVSKVQPGKVLNPRKTRECGEL
jgi:hypothetical protein